MTRSTQLNLLLLLILSAATQAFSQNTSTALDSNLVMGFETPFGWSIMGNSAIATFATSTNIRTQGSYAYALGNPANLTTLTSAPVASTATALSGVGNPGALFEVDVMLPTQQGNPVNQGFLQLFISSPSTKLHNVLVGMVSFSGLRPGIYTTMKFPLPDKVRNALGGATFNDLVFQFLLSSPGTGAGTYLFDNLRVRSVALVTATTGTKPPPGYGGSVDFVVFGGTPMAQVFDVGVVQVPDDFHLKLGTVGTTSVQLDLGYDGTPSFTCTYNPDSTDPNGKSYTFKSCTGGMQPGDLVGADWARLTIVGGDTTIKLRAQLAKNPVGDTSGVGIIPAMPTFWGDFDGCTPAPVAGTVVTVSSSCAAQAAQANKIVTAYFNKVNNGQTAPNWIVTPKPELARRHGNGAPNNIANGAPPPPGDPPFDQEGHINPGGDFDAYWRLNGDIENSTSNNQNTTELKANFSGHAVLFGNDVDLMSVNGKVDGAQSSTTSSVSATATGEFQLFLFETQIGPTLNIDASASGSTSSTAFSFNPDFEQDLEPQIVIPIWIFEITIGATADVGLNASGSFAPGGITLAVDPHASVGAHLFGGVNLGIASGGLDARVDLLCVGATCGSSDTPPTLAASALWTVDTDPTVCTLAPRFKLNGNATISAGGGEVDLVASFGVCPFCDDVSWTLFSWDPLVSYTAQLFPPVDIAIASFELANPTTTCKETLNVTISNPQDGTSVNARRGGITLMGAASNSFTSLACDSANTTFQWSLSPAVAGDTLTPSNGQGCNVNATFAQPAAPATSSSRTVNLTVTYKPTDTNHTVITETGNASSTVTVNALAPGAYIDDVNCLTGGMVSCTNAVNTSGGASNITIDSTNTIDALQLIGEVDGATAATTTTTWTAATYPSGTPMTIGTGTTISWNNGNVGFTGSQTTYNITMTTKNISDGSTFGTSTVQVQFVSLH